MSHQDVDDEGSEERAGDVPYTRARKKNPILYDPLVQLDEGLKLMTDWWQSVAGVGWLNALGD